jgi:hypothetical protein
MHRPVVAARHLIGIDPGDQGLFDIKIRFFVRLNTCVTADRCRILFGGVRATASRSNEAVLR